MEKALLAGFKKRKLDSVMKKPAAARAGVSIAMAGVSMAKPGVSIAKAGAAMAKAGGIGKKKNGRSAIKKSFARSTKSVDMSDVFEAMKKVRTCISKGAFTSRAYDSAKCRMLAIGASAEEAAEFARTQYDQANAIWRKSE